MDGYICGVWVGIPGQDRCGREATRICGWMKYCDEHANAIPPPLGYTDERNVEQEHTDVTANKPTG